MLVEVCTHLENITEVKQPRVHECEECVKIGSPWVHLRTCQTCGITLCCDSSPNRHASKHAHASGHPVIASAEPGERWLYCYVDEAYAQYQFRQKMA
jgi:Zn-finger in ubiquitin-hydrolases and other protein